MKLLPANPFPVGHPSTGRLSLFAALLVLSLAAAGSLLGAGVSEAEAQQHRRAAPGPEAGPAGGANLPAWARPGQGTTHGPKPAPAQQQQQPPPSLPGDPAIAPIGGLEWLALAGGAYAVNRLRRRDEKEESEDGDLGPQT